MHIFTSENKQILNNLKFFIMTTTANTTGKKLSTNSKEVQEAIRQHILECVYDYEGNQFKTLAEAKNHLNAEFERVAGHTNNVKRFPNKQERFLDYLQGIPFYFEFETYKIEEFLNGLGINPEGKEYDAKKIWNLYSYLIYRELTK